MKKLLIGLTTLALASQSFAQATVEDRVSELEANASLNIWSFRGTLVTRYDNISGEQGDDVEVVDATKEAQINAVISPGLGTLYAGALNAPAFDKTSNDFMRLRFSFDADANVSSNIKFYSRLTASKYMNRFATQGSDQDGLTDDISAPDAELGSQVVLEKAYADLAVPNSNFIFSVGRLPTVDGVPTHYWDGRARLGTYPMMSYNATLDGIALTYKMDELVGGTNKLAARVVYTPFSNINFGSPLGGNGMLSKYTNGDGNYPSKTDLVATQFDFSTGSTSFADNVGFIVQHLKSGKLQFNTGVDPRADATSVTENPTDLTLELQATTVALEFVNLMNSGLDVSLTHLISAVKSDGTLHAWINGVGYVKMGGYGCIDLSLSANIGNGCDEEEYKGNISVASLSYKLPISARIGFEYQMGSEKSFFFDGAGENMTSFYTTPGTGTHLYWTQMFSSNLSLRLGTMMQAYKYRPMGYGVPTQESDKKITTTYANLRLDF